MNKFIDEIYFDNIRFVLSHLKQLDLSSDEIVVVLLILMLQEKNKLVDINQIVTYSQFDEKQVDDIITLLASKYYLEIKIVKGQVNFDLSKLFTLETANNLDVSNLFKIFEEEFKRILTQNELVRLNEWLKLYSKELIIEALRRASIMNKLNFNYINRILENEYEK